MIVGSLQVWLLIREARTLKDKRQVVRSMLDRMKNEFNVSAAEVGALDEYRSAVLGFAAVGWDGKHVRDTLHRIAEAMRHHPIAEFVRCEIDA